jgi:hypothetical protein
VQLGGCGSNVTFIAFVAAVCSVTILILIMKCVLYDKRRYEPFQLATFDVAFPVGRNEGHVTFLPISA